MYKYFCDDFRLKRFFEYFLGKQFKGIFLFPNSKKNNLYLKIVSNSMCGINEEETNKNINKILSNVAKEVVITKKH